MNGVLFLFWYTEPSLLSDEREQNIDYNIVIPVLWELDTSTMRGNIMIQGSSSLNDHVSTTCKNK